MEIRSDDPADPAVARLLREHLDDVAVHSPAGSIHALSIEELRDPNIAFWSLRDGDDVIGCGALLELDELSGEVKSMRTARTHLRRGIASALLRQIVSAGRGRGYERLFLETGSQPAYAPARALYGRFGFVECGPFGAYVADPSSVFMRLSL